MPLPDQRGFQAEGGVELHPGEIFHEIAGRDFYGRLIRTLTQAGGYDCVSIETVTAETNCVLLTWDWRKGMVEGAAELDALVERLRRLRHEPDLRVDVVAHSAGGLLTRYFVRFGKTDVLDRTEPIVTYAGGHKVRPTDYSKLSDCTRQAGIPSPRAAMPAASIKRAGPQT